MKAKIISILTVITVLMSLTACGLNDNNDASGTVVDSVDGTNENVNENNIDATENVPDTNTSVNNTNDASNQITEEEAKNIAINHGGFNEEQVSRLYVEYEIDDGIPQYDVSYYYENVEYEYNIHAETGEIISYDRDND